MPDRVEVHDVGAPRARTTLAWQRTALALLAGSAALTRLTVDRLGWVALAAVAVAGPLAVWVFLESRRRSEDRSGRSPFALAVATVVLAGVELAALLTG
ncbi:DUF202 domain-containing protein [Nocardioides sp. GCM10027113]|uniref:DUF202 domain-containing protein n=1 Tax=unclassified Nocardioides TaxID=2615069 RepID=UPI0036231498